MKKHFIVFLVLLALFALASFNGCTKLSEQTLGPSVDEPDPVDSTAVVDTTANDSLITTAVVLSVEEDNSSVTGVSVLIKQGDPVVYTPWPEAGRNVTPVEPNLIEPGHYLFVGVKSGYDTCFVAKLIQEGNAMEVYLVMHPVESDTCPACPDTTTSVPNDTTVVSTTYHLTVTSGYGDGDYEVDTVVNLYADAPLPGDHFVCWIGGGSSIADSTNPETTIITPESDLTVEATYATDEPTTYHLTVTSGYGDGDYEEGEVINIYADAPVVGFHFVQWSGNTQYVSDQYNPETTVTMPPLDIIITAVYEQDAPPPTYHLTVNNGYGSDDYLEGEVVNISENPPTGYHFKMWSGNTQYVADPYNPETSVTMPPLDIMITAVYEQDAPVLYLHENLYWDADSLADIFVLKTNLAGNCSKQITYVVWNGTEGPMVAINLYTGQTYKFNPDNTVYYAGFDCVVIHKDDEFQINLGQPHLKDYLYSRVTYVYGPDIIPSQWHYDGRFDYPEPVILTTRILDESAGQWDTLIRQTQ